MAHLSYEFMKVPPVIALTFSPKTAGWLFFLHINVNNLFSVQLLTIGWRFNFVVGVSFSLFVYFFHSIVLFTFQCEFIVLKLQGRYPVINSFRILFMNISSLWKYTQLYIFNYKMFHQEASVETIKMICSLLWIQDSLNLSQLSKNGVTFSNLFSDMS